MRQITKCACVFSLIAIEISKHLQNSYRFIECFIYRIKLKCVSYIYRSVVSSLWDLWLKESIGSTQLIKRSGRNGNGFQAIDQLIKLTESYDKLLFINAPFSISTCITNN